MEFVASGDLEPIVQARKIAFLDELRECQRGSIGCPTLIHRREERIYLLGQEFAKPLFICRREGSPEGIVSVRHQWLYRANTAPIAVFPIAKHPLVSAM